ncbi:MAG: antibiotic biosynthesis monooxygenase [Bacteroidota bacterium]
MLPKPPYYAVIFTSKRTDSEAGEYNQMANRMVELAKRQKGFLGMESARSELGITVSYWESLEAIATWKQHVEHQVAQKLGRERWYENFVVRIAKVEREYRFP